MSIKTTQRDRPIPAVKVGDRIELIHMPEEPTFGRTFHPGDRGTITGINHVPALKERQISVDWDNGHRLLLLEGVDEYKVIEETGVAGGKK